jgi:type IV secretory pathway TrbL component
MTRTFLLTAVALFTIGSTAADAAMMAYKEGGPACAVQDENGAKSAPKDQGATADAAMTASKEGGTTCALPNESGAKAASKEQMGFLGGPDTRSRKAKSKPGGKPGGIEQED